MVLLDNDGFLTELTKLYSRTKTKGSVLITIKRHIPEDSQPQKKQKTEGGKAATPTTPTTPSEPICLIRARTEQKKISTHVFSKDLLKFQNSYNTILKANMDSLKKKQKKKTKKATKV